MLELELLIDVEGTADWRRRKAEEYPDDSRNIKAADLLERLAAQMKALEGGELHKRLEALATDEDDDRSMRYGEVVGEELRAVGFHSSPDTAEELLQSIIACLSDD